MPLAQEQLLSKIFAKPCLNHPWHTNTCLYIKTCDLIQVMVVNCLAQYTRYNAIQSCSVIPLHTQQQQQQHTKTADRLLGDT